MALGDLVVKVSANTAKFNSDIGRAGQMSKRFAKDVKKASSKAAKALAGVAVAASAIGLAMIKQSLETADAMAKMSQSAGVTTAAFTELAFAAKLSGVDLVGMQTTIKRLNFNMSEAVNGNQEFAQIFKSLGITITDTNGNLKDAGTVISELASIFSKIPDGAEKSALAIKLFGKSGSDIIPLLNAGSDGLARMRQEAEDLGIVMRSDIAKSAEQFNDNIVRMQTLVQGIATQLLKEFLPVMVNLSNAMVDTSKKSGVLQDYVQKLAFTMRSLVSIALGASTAISQVGSSIGASMAIIVEALKGNFTNATNIAKQSFSDIEANAFDFNKKMEAIWNKTATVQLASKQIVTEAEKKDAMEKIKASVRARVNAQESLKLQNEAIRLTQSSRTAQQIYNEEIDKYNLLLEKGLITQETYNISLERAGKKLEASKGKMGELSTEATKGLDDMTNSAKKFGDTLSSSIEKSLKTGKLDFRDFADFAISELQRIIQEQLSKTQASGGGAGDFLGGLLSSVGGSIGAGLGNIFNGGTSSVPVMSVFSQEKALSLGSRFAVGGGGGFFANGGRPPVGKMSMVGEKGAELFVPDTAGTIVPNNKIGGNNVTINQVYNIDSRTDIASIAGMLQRTAESTKNDIMRSLNSGGSFAGAVGRV